MLIVGKESGNVFIFKINNELNYEFVDSFTVPTQVTSLQLSYFTDILIVATFSNKTYAYQRNGDSYELLQTIETT